VESLHTKIEKRQMGKSNQCITDIIPSFPHLYLELQPRRRHNINEVKPWRPCTDCSPQGCGRPGTSRSTSTATC